MTKISAPSVTATAGIASRLMAPLDRQRRKKLEPSPERLLALLPAAGKNPAEGQI